MNTIFLGDFKEKNINLYEIKTHLLSVFISNFGGTITNIKLKDKFNIERDICLGFDRLNSLTTQNQYVGSTIGRYANRISNSSFSLNGKTYSLKSNEGENQLHGGGEFNQAIFDIKDYTDNSITLSLTSTDGTSGFPGNISVNITFKIESNRLKIQYNATTDEDTVLNLTNHSYFNLNGENNGNIFNQSVMIDADYYTELNADGIPNGKISSVNNTVFDLRNTIIIGDKIASPELSEFLGYDHNFCLNKSTDIIATAFSDKTGIELSVKTDMPGLQFYTSNMLDGINVLGKNNAQYGKYSAFCLETQYYPDSPNNKSFPSCILRKNETYNHYTEYIFNIR